MSEPTITIERTNPLHLREMSEAMTADSAEVARNLGTTPLRALWASYRKSLYSKSFFINGKIAAICGLSGSIFSDTAKPWLILTPECKKYPLRVAFAYRKELNEMSRMFEILEEYVPEDNEASIRMLELMGFKVSKNIMTVGDVKWYRAERRRA